MVRIFVDTDPSENNKIVLKEADRHHVIDVMRLGPGDALTVIDKNSGRQFHGKLDRAGGSFIVEITGEIVSRKANLVLGSILFALCKGKKNDIIVEKATELGARHIVLWQSERSVVKVEGARECEAKIKRWRTIAEGAAKQCKRTDIPKIYLVKGAAAALDALREFSENGDLSLMCSLSSDTVHPSKLQRPLRVVHWVVGPEGDLTKEEEELFRDAGFRSVTLGPLTLRAETAAIVAMGITHALWEV